MKAVIVDASTNIAVALRDDGQFVKLKNKAYEIGQEIQISAATVRFPKQAAIAASAALVLFAGAGYGVHEWNSPYSYVSLDASPSIEYALNRFDVVIAVNGLNEDGETVAESIGDSVRNTKIDKALEITVEALAKDNYISTADNSGMVIAVYSDNDSKKEELLATVSNIQASDGHEVAAVAVDKETMDKIDSGESISAVVSNSNNDIEVVANMTDGKVDSSDGGIEHVADSSVTKTDFSDGDSSPVKGGDKVEEQTTKTEETKVEDTTADKTQDADDVSDQQTDSSDITQSTNTDSNTDNSVNDKTTEAVESGESQTQETVSSDNSSEDNKKEDNKKEDKKKHDHDNDGSIAKGEGSEAKGEGSVEKTDGSPARKTKRAHHRDRIVEFSEEDAITED